MGAGGLYSDAPGPTKTGRRSSAPGQKVGRGATSADRRRTAGQVGQLPNFQGGLASGSGRDFRAGGGRNGVEVRPQLARQRRQGIEREQGFVEGVDGLRPGENVVDAERQDRRAS